MEIPKRLPRQEVVALSLRGIASAAFTMPNTFGESAWRLETAATDGEAVWVDGGGVEPPTPRRGAATRGTGGLATGTVTPLCGRGRLGGWETAATGGEVVSEDGEGLGRDGGGTADASQRRRYAGRRAGDRDGHATLWERSAGRLGNRRHGWGSGERGWGGARERRGWNRRRLAEAPLRGEKGLRPGRSRHCVGEVGWAVGNRRHGGEVVSEDGEGLGRRRGWDRRRLAEAPLRGEKGLRPGRSRHCVGEVGWAVGNRRHGWGRRWARLGERLWRRGGETADASQRRRYAGRGG